MARKRNAKIVATLGPASSSREIIESLYRAGADVFRLNFIHGTHDDHRRRLDIIRGIEREADRPIGVLLDLQGPKLRIGTFANGPVVLDPEAVFRLDLDTEHAGDASRVALPHRAKFAQTRVIVGGSLSERKGVNVPDVVLPLSPLTDKDHADLAFGLELGIDWVAMSFVQRAEDIRELRHLIGDRAGIVAKLEKPAAIASLEAIVRESDAVMVARGDLGVELPAEQVPAIQKRIVKACRSAGKPVIVATQMLESMVASPVPTRAEASDVATAIYDGADAVMLSAESASGSYPVESVRMMDRIIVQTESDPFYRDAIAANRSCPRAEAADAIGLAMRQVTSLLEVAACVAYTSSGHSALCMARERPLTPIVGMTPRRSVARRLALVWGVHPVLCQDVAEVMEVSDLACDTVRREGLGTHGQTVVISAGVPFGTPGTTNLLRIAHIQEVKG